MTPKPPIDWASYLAAFHARSPGITERVLERTLSGGHTPYRWLARAVSPRARLVVDVTCGTGAMGRELARDDRTVLGVSLSPDELAVAQRGAPGPWVCADAKRLPLPDASVDAVVSMFGAIVIQPVAEFFAEVGRVLRPGGMFAFMAPTVVPLHPRDLATSLGVVTRLRSVPRFPGPTEVTGYVPALVGTGLRKVEDARERYHFAVRTPADALDVIDALYLPLTTPERRQRTVDWLVDRTHRDDDVRISIAMRRFVALRQPTPGE